MPFRNSVDLVAEYLVNGSERIPGMLRLKKLMTSAGSCVVSVVFLAISAPADLYAKPPQEQCEQAFCPLPPSIASNLTRRIDDRKNGCLRLKRKLIDLCVGYIKSGVPVCKGDKETLPGCRPTARSGSRRMLNTTTDGLPFKLQSLGNVNCRMDCDFDYEICLDKYSAISQFEQLCKLEGIRCERSCDRLFK